MEAASNLPTGEETVGSREYFSPPKSKSDYRHQNVLVLRLLGI